MYRYTTEASGSCTVTAYTLTTSDYDSTTYEFQGWDKNSDGSSDASAGGTITLTGNVTYEAILEVKDDRAPSVSFSPNGGDWATSHSTTITVSDTSGVDSSSIKYTWSTSSSASASSGTSTTSGSALSKSDGTGTYYLCVYAEDNLGNSGTTCSSAFKIDNTGPTCSASGSVSGGSYTTVTVTASDDHSGLHATETYCFMNCDSSSSYSTSSSYSQSGLAATFTPKVKDAAGNITTCNSVGFTKVWRYNSSSASCQTYVSGVAKTVSVSTGASGYNYSSSSAASSGCQTQLMSNCYSSYGSCQSCSYSCSTSSWINLG